MSSVIKHCILEDITVHFFTLKFCTNSSLLDEFHIVLSRFLFEETRFFALLCPEILVDHKRILNTLCFLPYSLFSRRSDKVLASFLRQESGLKSNGLILKVIQDSCRKKEESYLNLWEAGNIARDIWYLRFFYKQPRFSDKKEQSILSDNVILASLDEDLNRTMAKSSISDATINFYWFLIDHTSK